MKDASPSAQRRRVGTEIISGKSVPVYESPSGARLAEVTDPLTGQPNLVSLTAAKQFKTGNYRLGEDFLSAMDRAFFSLSEDEQEHATQKLLTTMFQRVRSTGVHFNFMFA